VHGVSALNLGIVWRGECNARRILACNTKICAHKILAHGTKVVRTKYWCNKEVVHTGYRCAVHALPYGVVAHAKYGCTFSNWCVQNHLDGLLLKYCNCKEYSYYY
jgi:hypothetical protein